MLRGFDFPLTSNFIVRSGTVLVLANCAGHVHLESVRCGTRVTATDCAWLSATDCRFVGVVSLTRCDLQANACAFRGHDAVRGPFGAHLYSSKAIALEAATVGLSSCDVAGGAGSIGLYGSVAITMTGSGLGVTGVAAVTIAPGSPTLAGETTIAGTGGALVTDPSVSILPAAGGVVSPSIPHAVRPVPALAQSAARIGQTLTGTMRASPGDAFAALLGLPMRPLYLPQLEGALALAPAGAVLLASGTVGGGGQATWSLQVPDAAVLLGQTVVTQGAAGGAQLRLSSAAVATIH